MRIVVAVATVMLLISSYCSAQTVFRPMKLVQSAAWAVLEKSGDNSTVKPYMSSLASGESATGIMCSPDFKIAADTVSFDLCGYDGDIGGLGLNYVCLRDADTGEVLRKMSAPSQEKMNRYSWDVKDLQGRGVIFEAHDGNANNGCAWLGFNNFDAGDSLRVTFNSTGIPAGWHERPDNSYVTACGVPFIASKNSQSILNILMERNQVEIDCGFTAKRFYLLGMINSWDHGTSEWSWPDYSNRLFIGDSAGDVVIEYADNTKDIIPLIFGYTMWWYANYIGGDFTEPFASDPNAKSALDSALYIYPTGSPSGHAYMCSLQPADKLIKSIRFVDNPKKKGAPVVTGITFDTDAETDRLLAAAAAPPANDDERKWIETHTIKAGSPSKAEIARRLDALRRVLYTCDADRKGPIAAEIPDNFKGPVVSFKGTINAEILNNIYFASLQDMDDKVDPDGTFHTSTLGSPNWGAYFGFGTWRAKCGMYYGHAWARDLGRVLQEMAELGYDSDTRACTQWCNKQLMWFPEQFPKYNIDGKPIPGHWVRVINIPEFFKTEGLPEHFGNLENDGHGIIMLFQYKTWLHTGRSPEYVNEKWQAIKEAAEYICWQFDNPQISRAGKNYLFSDSEGGPMKPGIFCDTACWMGMLAYAEMAQAAGRIAEAKRWRSYADKLKDGLDNFYPAQEKEFGDTWDKNKDATWPYGHATLAPVILWPDYYGLDISTMPKDWLERSRNTLKRQLKCCEPAHASGTAMGYGQGFITEGCLLLDEMKDATGCLDWLAKYTYRPGFKPYIVPEGCEIDESHKWWRRTGDLGNGVQEGEAIKCVRIILGIDDINAAKTRFMPRMPLGWIKINVADYPIMTAKSGQITGTTVKLSINRRGKGYDLRMLSGSSINEAAVRVGPFPVSTRLVKATVNGRPQTIEAFKSGDSAWAWIDNIKNATDLTIRALPKQ